MTKILIDPGHGGWDPGAVGPGGTHEADITLAVALKLGAILSKFAEVRYTRTTDTALGNTVNADLAARGRMANTWGADIVASVHCNSGDRSALGGEIYTTPGQGPSDILAENIVSELEAGIPELPWRKDYADGDSDKEARFYMLRVPNGRAVLWEMDFISNPERERLLCDPVWQDRLAMCAAKGIAKYLGVNLGPRPCIVLNGGTVKGKLIDGHIWTPLRPLADLLGRSVAWSAERHVAVLSSSTWPPGVQGTADAPKVCAGEMVLDGRTADGATWVPAAPVVRAFGYDVAWDEGSQTATICERR